MRKISLGALPAPALFPRASLSLGAGQGPITTHAATGTLAGAASVIAGLASSERATHAATGVLATAGAVITGAAASQIENHAATGALAGDGAVIVGTAPAFDFIISTDADWDETTWPAGILSGGGRIGVAVPAGSAYAPTTINGINPSALLTIEPVVTGSWPRCDRFIFNACGNLKVAGIEFVSTAWGSNPQSALQVTGTLAGDVDIRGNRVQGNYRGDPDAYGTFDFTTSDYPEYAQIWAQISGGSYPLGQLTVFNNYVGDLVADGLGIPLIANSPGGTGFAGYMDVVGGRITHAECTAGGTGYSSATPFNHPYSSIGWTGKTPFVGQMPSGMTGSCVVPVGVTLYVRDNEFRFCNDGFKPSLTVNGSIVLEGNVADGIYQDGYAFGVLSAAQSELIAINWNQYTRMFNRVGDPSDPHGDGIQQWQTGLSYIPNLEIIGNEFMLGATRCRDGQAFFISDADVGTEAYEAHIVGNVGMFLAPNGLSVSRGSNCFLYGNTIMPYDPAAPEHTSTVQVQLSNNSGLGAYAQNYVANNVTEQVSVSSLAIPNVELENNTATGRQTSTTAYATLFAVPAVPTTIAELRVNRQTIGASADRGAYRDPLWIDHATRTYDRSLEPSFLRFPTLYGQAQSTDVYSAWCRLIGGPDNQTVTASGGVFQTATSVDTAGNATGISGDQTSATLPRRTWIRTRVTTGSGAGSTPYTVTLTVRGTYTFTFSAVTSALTAYTQVDNTNTAYSVISANKPSVTGVAKILVGCRFKVDAYAANTNIIADFNTTKFRLHMTTTQWRFIIGSGSIISARWGMSQSAGTYRTLLMAFDLTKATVSDGGVKAVQDYSELAYSTGGAAFDSQGGTRRLASSDLWPTSLGMFASSNGGGGLMDGGMEWAWIHTWDENGAMPDIRDPLVFAAFSADRFAANNDGSVTGILPQPHWFLKGSLVEWNSTLVNLGSATGSDAVRATGLFT